MDAAIYAADGEHPTTDWVKSILGAHAFGSLPFIDDPVIVFTGDADTMDPPDDVADLVVTISDPHWSVQLWQDKVAVLSFPSGKVLQGVRVVEPGVPFALHNVDVPHGEQIVVVASESIAGEAHWVEAGQGKGDGTNPQGPSGSSFLEPLAKGLGVGTGLVVLVLVLVVLWQFGAFRKG